MTRCFLCWVDRGQFINNPLPGPVCGTIPSLLYRNRRLADHDCSRKLTGSGAFPGMRTDVGWPGLESLRSPGSDQHSALSQTGASLRSSPGHPSVYDQTSRFSKVNRTEAKSALPIDSKSQANYKPGNAPPEGCAPVGRYAPTAGRDIITRGSSFAEFTSSCCCASCIFQPHPQADSWPNNTLRDFWTSCRTPGPAFANAACGT